MFGLLFRMGCIPSWGLWVVRFLVLGSEGSQPRRDTFLPAIGPSMERFKGENGPRQGTKAPLEALLNSCVNAVKNWFAWLNGKI